MGMIENIRARGQIARARGAQTLRERLAIGRQLRSTPEGREEVRRVVEENRAAGRTRRIDATGGADRAAGQVRGWEKLVGARISTFLEAERAEAESIHKPQARDEALRRYDYLRIAA
ncbi:MAG TPA: hypothetical protein VLF20_05295, partial [Patescibacteria group bacterium]|nr:hypothetical protein [Patescibacteria group bacterium]